MCLQMQGNGNNKTYVGDILGLKQLGVPSARANLHFRFRVYLNNFTPNVTFNRSRFCDKIKKSWQQTLKPHFLRTPMRGIVFTTSMPRIGKTMKTSTYGRTSFGDRVKE